MTPQEIGLLVLLAIVAVYVVAAWLSRSKSGQETSDVLLEARLPQSGASRELLNPSADTASLRNRKKNLRRKKSRTNAKAPPQKKAPAGKRTQKHHASPKPVAKMEPSAKSKSGIKPAPASEGTKQAPAPPESAKPVQKAVAAPAPAEKTKPGSKPAPVEEIDPKLTGQILEVDDRLDAIEKLVASIEESLATFEETESETQSARKPGEAQAA